MSKLIRFNAFQMNTPGHQSPGLWRHPRDNSHQYTSAQHWTELARLLEYGLFDAIFLADVLGVYDVYQGNIDAALKHGIQLPLNDPLALVPLMANVTRHLGFGVTCALSYEHPYPFARRMSTLDHLTKGRVGWNIVTGYLDSAARNLGLHQQLSHDERYDLADEYLDVVYKLWEQSWDDQAVRHDKKNGVYTDPAHVHPIRHQGRFFNVPGIHLCEPSPQRTPLLFQAGTSKRGTAFAARHAECSFVSGPSKKVVKRYVDETRAAVLAAGRQAEQILIYAQALIITAETSEAAHQKYQDYLQYINIEASLTLLSGWTGVDFSQFPLDATIDYIDSDAGRSALASFSAADPDKVWTVREAAQFIGLGGRGPVLVGNPREISDQLEAWVDETGIDGFNLAFALSHETISDVVKLIVPELQRRHRYKTHYTDGTLRHQLFGRGNHLPLNHIGRQTKITAATVQTELAA
ncbi:LLM class flavin-dependent oxidoreductase [Undibacterium jejuense]|uniref:LLM class flavin-dependent oxidoreductase n=1 Tax=Undibacterium jejuense TaxID=1344949 RepID=A0A923HP60_9BURK|nr:LLM class flavin-dependent oxidoreductase [Undibacterium jejuense]MBC3863151.1 LLM class flavin-dependent oxidoreductase [Undibacterium jejuense]